MTENGGSQTGWPAGDGDLPVVADPNYCVDMRATCPTRTPEVHEMGEFPMSCYRCHVEADS